MKKKRFYNDKRGVGQLGIAVIVAIFIFIVGIPVINIIMPEVTTARSVSGLNCGNASAISDGTKLTCLLVDLVVPYFILIIISASGGYILSRILI